MANELIDKLRELHPDYKNTSDEKIYNYLKDPKNFKTAFPDYKNTSDEKISGYVAKHRPAPAAQKPSFLQPSLKIDRPVPKPTQKIIQAPTGGVKGYIKTRPHDL